MGNQGEVSSIYPIFSKSWFYEVLLKNSFTQQQQKSCSYLKCQLMNAENKKFKTSLFWTPDKMDLINGY